MRSEDLQQLSLEDASVDAVVTEDVFEHVHDPSRAFAEVARVLRPGGVHVFTVPFHSAPTTTSRAVIGASGEIQHLLPPEYHGDPLSSKGVLVISDFGRDLPDLIERASGLRTIGLAVTDPWRGILEPCTVFVSH